MRVLRIVLAVMGVLFLVLAINRLNVRRIEGTGLCGSIVQGSTHDDGGSSTPDCNRLRRQDGLAAEAFATIGIAGLGFVIGLSFYTRNR